MSKQHTPTPWRFKKVTNFLNPNWVIGSNDDLILSIQNGHQHEDDAKFIVKAVNNHDRLVEALGHTLNSLSSFEDIGYMGDEYFKAKKLYKELTELK